MKLKKEFHKLDSEQRLYNLQIPIIGLTGGIATGKSEVSKRLKGHPIIDADANVKEIYKTQESLEFIQKHFPMAIVDGAIDFPTLREKAFSDAENKKLIEDFIYQRLPEQFLKAYDSLGRPEYLIYDVPLLFEKSLDKLVDIKVTVYCPREVQLERLLKRDSIDEKLANKILDSQLDIEEKKKRSDFVIENTSTLQDLDNQIQMVFNQLIES